MTEKVVYFLGAGFSAPLGIPTMSNFMEKAKDMYFDDREKYKLFEDIFDKIKALSYVNIYYKADLTNIEEIMSILQMQISIKQMTISKDFTEFIRIVIEHYTPQYELNQITENNWKSKIFGDNICSKYGYFISSLFNLNLQLYYSGISANPLSRIKSEYTKSCDRTYSIITTNYDLIFENYAFFMNNSILKRDELKLQYNKGSDNNSCRYTPILAKIHGCIEKDNIVPPTYNKNISANSDIENAWKLAHSALEEANYIRIIGYSLPETDSYLKYLFKSAMLSNQHLKKIDVLCLDPSKEIEKRYKEFIKHPKFRFVNNDLDTFFKNLKDNTLKKVIVSPIDKKSQMLCFTELESTHEEFFNN